MNSDKWLGSRIVYLVEAGSHAYGTNTAESDYDYRGAAIPPKSYFFGLHNFEQANAKSVGRLISNSPLLTTKGECNKTKTLKNLPESDTTIWSLKKMVNLAADGNPNMIELLFTSDINIIYLN